jgi:hypothetical protein
VREEGGSLGPARTRGCAPERWGWREGRGAGIDLRGLEDERRSAQSPESLVRDTQNTRVGRLWRGVRPGAYRPVVAAGEYPLDSRVLGKVSDLLASCAARLITCLLGSESRVSGE